jgi:hypothetical protein
MNLSNPGPLFWYVAALFLAVELSILAFQFRSKIFARRKKADSLSLSSVRVVRQLGQSGVLREIDRLRAGGEIDDRLIRGLSDEDRALFEVGLIDALNKWPREDQHQLRSMLIKHGYDEQCSRRLLLGNLSCRIRASTLLDLLRPQSQGKFVQNEGKGRGEDRFFTRAAGSSSLSDGDE